MENLLLTIFSPEFGFSVLRVTTPILFAALAAIITSKAGVLNIAYEGIMLWAALMGVIGSAFTQNLIIGILCGILSGVGIALLMSYFTLKLKANIVLTGIALNAFASGGTVFVLYMLTKDKGVSNSLKSLTVPNIELPVIKSIPVIGAVFSGHNLLTYVALISVGVVWVFINKTRLGLRIRAVGENPDAAESVGINVNKIRFLALVLGGALASLGGIYMSMGYLPWFTRDMVAGRGFIAIAAQNLGGGSPFPTLLASLAFGIADTLSNILQSLRVPAEFVQALPYIFTLAGLIIYSDSKKRRARKKILKSGKINK